MNRVAQARAAIAERQALVAKATPGPWRVGSHYGIHLYADQESLGTTLLEPDAALIATACNEYAERLTADLAVLDRHCACPDYDGIAHCGHCERYTDWPCPDTAAVLDRYTGVAP